MKDHIDVKRYGFGSFSLLIAIFSIIFSCTFIRGKNVGEYILGALGMSLPYGIISIILLCLSLYIGHKYKHHRYAKTGATLAMVFLVLLLIASVITIILPLVS